MTSTVLYSAMNPHVVALESAFDQTNMPVQWLVIAQDDMRVTNLLSVALSGQSAVVLHVPQDEWDFRSREVAEAIEWALQQGEIRNLVLVGSSQVGDEMGSAVTVPAKKVTQCNSGIGKLIAGVQHHIGRIREVQDAFAEQVQCLSQIPAVRSRCDVGALNVCGLLYRPESGVFLAYEPGSNTFQPLYS